MKKIISLILCLSLVLTFEVPVKAEVYNSVSSKIKVFYLSDTERMEITYDTENIPKSKFRSTNNFMLLEKFQIRTFQEDQLVQSVEGEKGGSKLIVTNYENGNTTQEVIDINSRVKKKEAPIHYLSIPSNPNDIGSLIGAIKYKKDMLGEHRKAKVYSKLEYSDEESYTIYGQQKDTMAVIVGIVFSIISVFLSGGVSLAQQIAIAIISAAGGSVAGGAIGVSFSDEVSVLALHYSFRAKTSDGSISNEVIGTSRRVKTKKSKYFGQWFHEEPTPTTWKKDDMLPIYFWNDLFSPFGICPGVESYGY